MNKEVEKLNFKEFRDITFWVLKLIFKMEPKRASLYLVFTTLRRLRDLGNFYIFGKILDILIKTISSGNPTLKALIPYLAIMLGYNILTEFLSFFGNYFGQSIRISSRYKIRKVFYSELYKLGIQNLEQPEINNKIQRSNDYLESIIPYLTGTIGLFADLFTLVTTLIIAASITPIIVPLIVLSVVPYLIVDRKYRGIFYKYNFDNTEGIRSSRTSADDLTNAGKLPEISINGAFSFLDFKYNSFQKSFTEGWLGLFKRWQTRVRGLFMLADILIFAAYIKVFERLLQGISTIGDITFQLRALGSFQDSLISVISDINDLFESAFRLRDIYTLFHIEPSLQNGTVKMEKLSQGPEIIFKNVWFKYPNSEKYVIENLNLKISGNEKVAIVGHNGAGKTTIVKLLCRIYQVTQGEILINGVNINELTIEDWYKNVGVLFQDYNVYPNLTVKENIAIGNPNIPVNEIAVRLAAQSADAINFIEEYPKRFDQVLSEKFKEGIRPSTGQWQKIAIARFFYRNAPLVVFDEPTSSIDALSEYNIFNKIYEFFNNKTVVIISHRFSTVRNADRIILIEKGKILEEGNHDELMMLGGKYFEAFTLQAKGYVQSITDEKSSS